MQEYVSSAWKSLSRLRRGLVAALEFGIAALCLPTHSAEGAGFVHSGMNNPINEQWNLLCNGGCTVSPGADERVYWEIDASEQGGGQYVGYRISQTDEGFLQIMTHPAGWRMTVICRVAGSGQNGLNSPFFGVRDSTHWWQVSLVDTGDPNDTGMYYQAPDESRVLIAPVDIFAYHTYQLEYAPTTETVAVHLDGRLQGVLSRADVYSNTDLVRQVNWGDYESDPGGSISHWASVAFTARSDRIDVGPQKQLFIDDRFVCNPQNLTLVVNHPRLDRELLVLPEYPWENQLIGAYTSVIQEGDLVHMWYESRDLAGTWSCAYALSTDRGRTFAKPNLQAVAYEGSYDNNLVLTNGLGHHVFVNSPNAPTSQHFGMLRHIAGNANSNSLYTNSAFVSADGISWLPFGEVPFLYETHPEQDPASPTYQELDSQNVLFWDTRLSRYVLFPRIRVMEHGRAVGRTVSQSLDGFPQGVSPAVLQSDTDDGLRQFYTSAVVQYPFASDAYVAFPAMLNDENGPVDIQFAASRDGITWLRTDRTPIIHSGFALKDGTPNEIVDIPYENGSLYAGYGLTRDGDELYLYYTTLPHKHEGGTGGIVTRAAYRLDGFMSLDAGTATGECSTPPLVFSGSRLQVNVQCEMPGWLKVEVLGENEVPITGFSAEDADIATGDYISKTLTWNGSSDVRSLAGLPVRLHFIMNQAKLFAFQFVGSPGDWDQDGDADQEDFGYLQACITGPESSVSQETCRAADLNNDGHVDLRDIMIFRRCVSGPTIPANPNCTD